MTTNTQLAAFNYLPNTNLVIFNISAAYTVLAADAGKIINSTSGTYTIALLPAAAAGAGFNVTIWNTSATATDAITIDPNAAETIDGLATLILRRGEGMQIVCNGTNWETGNKKTMRGYAENILSTDPKPTASGTNAVAVGSNAQATGSNSAAVGQAAIAAGNYSLSVGLNTQANGDRSIAIGNNTVIAGSTYSSAIGTNSGFGGSVTATGSGAMALGGSYASGVDSFAAGIANNTSTYGAQGANSIAMGIQSKTSLTGVSIGQYVVSTGNRSLAIGYQANASSLGAIAIGGYAYGAIASTTYAVAIGDGANSAAAGAYALGWSATLASTAASSYALGSENKNNTLAGKLTFGPNATPGSGVPAGNPKMGIQVLTYTTADASPSILTVATSTGNAAASATNQVILPNNSAFSFTGTIVARQQAAGGTASAAWQVQGLIRREGTAASTTLVASTVTAISNVPAWTLALTADTTNGGLAITATGAAATNIRWVATINTSEVTYA